MVVNCQCVSDTSYMTKTTNLSELGERRPQQQWLGGNERKNSLGDKRTGVANRVSWNLRAAQVALWGASVHKSAFFAFSEVLYLYLCK